MTRHGTAQPPTRTHTAKTHAAHARTSKICVRANASTTTPANFVSVMPLVTGAPIWSGGCVFATRAAARGLTEVSSSTPARGSAPPATHRGLHTCHRQRTFTSAARARATRLPWLTQNECRMWAQNSTAMPRAMARLTSETALTSMPASRMAPPSCTIMLRSIASRMRLPHRLPV
jgi:hypothetical protein